MAQRTIAVLTAVHHRRTQHLSAALASVEAQRLPRGWDWRWVVQVDGDPEGEAARECAADPRVSAGGNRRAGIAATRNLGLARAVDADLVRVLDGDDLLPEGTLGREIEVMETHPRVQWSVSAALDLHPDGTATPFSSDPRPGPLPRHAVLDHWRSHPGEPVLAGTLCVRTPALLALGGWMALPAAEDSGLLLALDATAPGWFIGTPGLLYRQWEGQVTRRPEHVAEEEHRLRRALIGARAELLAGDPAPPRS